MRESFTYGPMRGAPETELWSGLRHRRSGESRRSTEIPFLWPPRALLCGSVTSSSGCLTRKEPRNTKPNRHPNLERSPGHPQSKLRLGSYSIPASTKHKSACQPNNSLAQPRI
jgi:hypothetical protein